MDVVEILDDEDEENLAVINICPSGDEDLDSSGDLAIMQQYYSLPTDTSPAKDKPKQDKQETNQPTCSLPNTSNTERSQSPATTVLCQIESIISDNRKAGDRNTTKDPTLPVIQNVESLVGGDQEQRQNHSKPTLEIIPQDTNNHVHEITPGDTRTDPMDISELETELPKQQQNKSDLEKKLEASAQSDDHASVPPSWQTTRPPFPTIGYPFHTLPSSLHMGLHAALPSLHGHTGPIRPQGPLSMKTNGPISMGANLGRLHGPTGPVPPRQRPQAAPSRPGFVCQVKPPLDVVSDTPVFGLTQWTSDKSGQAKPSFLCNFCQMKTMDQEAFLNHILTHMFVCKACGQQAFSRLQIINHTAMEHPELHAQLGHLEIMQVAKLSLKNKHNLHAPTDSVPNGVSQIPANTLQQKDENYFGLSGPLHCDFKKHLQFLEDNYVCCELCKVTTRNSDLVSWSAHLYMHHYESIIRIHCTLCGIYKTDAEEMIKHFTSDHFYKGTGVTYGLQALQDDKLVYLWFCPQCQHKDLSIGSMANHLREKHTQEIPAKLHDLLKEDIRESLLERSAGVQSEGDLSLPGLVGWASKETTEELSIETPPLPFPVPEQSGTTSAISVDSTSPNDMGGPSPPYRSRMEAKFQNDKLVSHTRVLPNIVVKVKDYYSYKNGVYSCRSCIYRTRLNHQVAEHMWAHIPGCKWTCAYCKLAKKRRGNILRHLHSKHRTLPLKVVIQVPTLIGYDNKPMNVQRQRVAKKSTSMTNVPHRTIASPDLNSSSSLDSSDVLSQSPPSIGNANKPIYKAKSSINASSPGYQIINKNPTNLKMTSTPKSSGSKSSTPKAHLTPSSSWSSLSSLVKRTTEENDDSSCWVCNVCHRKDSRRSLMRTHLMFAHPEFFTDDRLALARIKKPSKDYEEVVAEAACKRRRMAVSLLPVEKIYMYEHLKRVISGDDFDQGYDEGEENVIMLDSDGESYTETSQPQHEGRASKSTGKSKKCKSSRRKSSSPKARYMDLPVRPIQGNVSIMHDKPEAFYMLYGCYYCQEEFGNSAAAREHLIIHHHTKEPIVINLKQKLNPALANIYYCTNTDCYFSTFLQQKYLEHVIKHAPEVNLDDFHGRYSCIYCTVNTAFDKKGIQKHVYKNHPLRPQACIDVKNKADKLKHILFMCPNGKCNKSSYDVVDFDEHTC